MTLIPTPSDQLTRLVIEVPNAKSRGFLKRQRRAMQIQRLQATFQSQMKRITEAGKQVPVELVDQLDAAWTAIADFILDYVTEPSDRVQAMDAILELSQDDLTALMQRIQEGGTATTDALPLSSAEPTSVPSGTG